MQHENVKTDFSSVVSTPRVDQTAFIHPLAAVIGNVVIGKRVMVSPFASVRGDEGQPLYIGDESNVQDGVVIHGLETEHNGDLVAKNTVEVNGQRYAVYIGAKVSLAHQVQIHGPASVGDETFVGMQSLIFRSRVGENCVIEPQCLIMGVTIPDGRYVPAGSVVKQQADADNLPVITADYPLKDLNKGVVHVNVNLADGYRARMPR
ncbi:MAG: carbonic anhydrase [Desulfobacterota bacterium]|nr:carbonic anhydrase [Thermodesulfobacteriota bacterium]